MNKRIKGIGVGALICLTIFSSTSGATLVFADSINNSKIEYSNTDERTNLGNKILQHLKYNDDDTYTFDAKLAVSDGISIERANNAKNMFENFSKEEVRQFEELRLDNNNARALTLAAILAALGTIGFGWLVTEILNLGAQKACQKWGNSSKTPKIFKDYCKAKGYIK